MTDVMILLLAAGSSTRMGQPKQLLAWGDASLIEHQILTLIKTGNPVSVVLGSNADLIIPVVEKYDVSIFINQNWEKGMGSSISYGTCQIIKNLPGSEGVLITLLDQPLITTSYIEKMLLSFRPGSQQIIASRTASGRTGVPVLFDKIYFKDLAELGNDEGAKKILQRYSENVISLEGGNLLEDIDTPQSYRLLLNRYAGQQRIR
jgi:molybdenum cofactor cytidylyltransferase